LARGCEALSVWFDERHTSWTKEMIIEFPIKCVEVEGVQIGGKLDKVELLGGDKVAVTDYKTGRAKSRNEIEGKTKDGSGDIKRQLTFYKLLLTYWDNGRYKMQKGTIEFLEPTDTGKIKIEDFEITEEEVEELKETIKRVADEITNLKFWDNHCDEKDCKWCGYRKLV
jgi:DNA helicase II / ATP-dependent DNA helicase PcrA